MDVGFVSTQTDEASHFNIFWAGDILLTRDGENSGGLVTSLKG